MSLLRFLLGVFVVLIGTIAAHLLAVPENAAYGFDEITKDLSWLSICTIAMAMLFGILANSVWDNFPNTAKEDHEFSIGIVLRKAINSIAFIRAVFVSPIVFMVVYASVQDEPDLIVAHLFAFQNGFFWDSILKSRAAQS